MSAPPPKERRPLLPLLLIHFGAAVVCFTFLTVVSIAGCLIFIVIVDDPGGPLFFPVFALGVLFSAAAITALLAGAALFSDLLRRRYGVPVWLPPLVVFALAAGLSWLVLGDARPAVPLLAGGIVVLAFIIHWAAISTVWFLPRLLFRLFRVQPPSRRTDQPQQ